MSPLSHACISWCVANARPLSKRDRFLVFLAGILPDIDGVGLFVSEELYFRWHHIVFHNLAAALASIALLALFAQQRAVTLTLAFLSFHLHLASDYFGSGGAEGPPWVLPYLYPALGTSLEHRFEGPPWYWNQWQWPINSWQNAVCSLLAFAGWVYIAVRLDRTWFEFIWLRGDKELCATLRKWLGGTASEEWTPREAAVIRRGLIGICVAVVFACVLAGYHS